MSGEKRSLRYLAYCRAHGHENDPDGMLALDREEWPGGAMAGFKVWIQMCWSKFLLLNPEINPGTVTDEDHRQFDVWLESEIRGEKDCATVEVVK